MAQAGIVVKALLLATVLPISCSAVVEASEVFVASGSVAVLPCVITSLTKHSAAVTWKRIIGRQVRTVWRRNRSGLEFRPVGQAPQARCPHPNFGNSDFSLHIQGTREEDAGMYQCEVEGHFKDVMLRVIKVSLSPVDVFEGDRLTLSCSVSPRPANTLTKWELNGSPVTSRSGTWTYAVNKVSQKDAGTWSCLTGNKHTGAKASTSVQVKGILDPKDNSAVVYAQLGSSVTLPCVFSSKFLFNSSSWNRVSKASDLPTALPASLYVSSGPEVLRWSSLPVDRTAYIGSVQDGDEGTYTCSGELEDDHGRRVKAERNIQLVTARVLSSSRNGETTLTCRISSSRHATSYEWIHVEYGANDTRTFTSVQRSKSEVLTVPKGRRLGGWVCRFYNRQQLLGNATYHLQMMSGLEGQQESTSANKVVLIIGLCLLMILLVLVLLQLCKNHRRRRMILQYPAMETIVHLATTKREFKERLERGEKMETDACGENAKSGLV